MKLLFLMWFFLMPVLSLAKVMGHDQGNGGDVYAIQFVDNAHQVLSYLQKHPFAELDLKALEKVVNSAKVESTENLLKLNGIDKDAINYPSENRIIFSRKRWTSMEMAERFALVLHEYLGLMGVQDTSYQFSNRLLKDMTVQGSMEVALRWENTGLRIRGEAAKALYDALEVPASPYPAEAGDFYFKSGKSYNCTKDDQYLEYWCDFTIENPKKGKIK